MWGGSGSDVFIFDDTRSNSTIYDFDIANDSIYLDLESFDDFAIEQSGSNATLLNDNNVIAILRNTDSSNLERRDNTIIDRNSPITEPEPAPTPTPEPEPVPTLSHIQI